MPLLQHDNISYVPTWTGRTALPLTSDTNLEPVISAVQNKTIHHFASSTPDSVKLVIDSAANAFVSWSQAHYNKRLAILLQAADILTARTQELAEAQMSETSCLLSHAHLNIHFGAEIIREVASSITNALTGAVPPIAMDGMAFTLKQAIGPILLIPPWNSAIVLCVRGMVSALAAGCTVALKASELCSYTHSLIVSCFEDAGVPPGVVNQLQTRRQDAAKVTEALIRDERIRKVEFIGSAAVGSKIGEMCGRYLKPVLMELGGKSPAIVLADADLDAAVKAIVAGAFMNHGQICCSTERVVVVEEIAQEFQALLKQEMETVPVVDFGSTISRTVADHAHHIVDEALQNGAQLLVGGNTFIDETQLRLKPTVLTNVPSTATIRDDETFGPSLSLYVVISNAEAIKLANSSKYGLIAAIFTRNAFKALEMAKQLDFGSVAINSMTLYDPATLPIKGVKASGWGSNNASWGIEEFLVEKTIGVHGPKGAVGFG